MPKMSGAHVARGGATRSVPAPCESTASSPAETRFPRSMLPSQSWYVRPAGGCGRPDTTSVPPPMGSHRSCPRAPVAEPTGTSEITRDPPVGRDVPGSVRALSSLGAVAGCLAVAPSGGLSGTGGSGSGRLATRGDTGSGARFTGGEEVVAGSGSGARATGGRGAAADAGLGARVTGGTGAGAATDSGAGPAGGAGEAGWTSVGGVSVGGVCSGAIAGAGDGLTAFGGLCSGWRDTLRVTRGSDGIHA